MLENVLGEEERSFIERTVQKAIGVTIKELNDDITLKLQKNPLLEFSIDTTIPLKSAKKIFRKGYLEKVLRSHFGDISAASRILKIDRKTIHRMIKEINIDIKECRRALVNESYVKEEAVNIALNDILRNYEETLHPQKIRQAYEHLGSITEEIVKGISFSFIPLKDAEAEFEREFISAALKENNNSLPKTAKKIGLSHVALYRKAKTLRLI